MALAGASALAAALASAQMVGHGMAPPARPLHARLALADAVALGTVERVELGRIAVMDARAWRGAPGPRFEVKRAPSQAPELRVGDRVLWLLRGARSPYVLLDEPRELLVIDPARAALVEDALARLLEAGDDASRRAAYLDWIDGEDAGLRAIALRALADRAAGGVPRETSLERARIALDPSRPEAVRLASASLASQHREGLALLYAGIARPDAAPPVVGISLGLGVLGQDPAVTDAVLAALSHPNPEVRRAALGPAKGVITDPRVRRAVEAALDEVDPELRRNLETTLDVVH